MTQDLAAVAHSSLPSARGAVGPPPAPGVRQVTSRAHPVGLGTDIQDGWWQTKDQTVVMPRRIVERLRDVHLAQLDELRLLRPQALEANHWDLRYREALSRLEELSRQDVERRRAFDAVMEELEKADSTKLQLRKDMEALNKQFDEMERVCPGLKRRLAQDAEWRGALSGLQIQAHQPRHVRMKPVRQAFATWSSDPAEEDRTMTRRELLSPERSLKKAEQQVAPDPWVPDLTCSTSQLSAAEDVPGVVPAVSEIEAARRGLNDIVSRLRDMGPLEAEPRGVSPGGGASARGVATPASPSPQAAIQAVRASEAEIRQLKMEVQAARTAERQARNEAAQLGEELRRARAELKGSGSADQVKALKAKVQEQDQVIKTLTMQLATIHANWADDIEKLHQKYMLQVSSARSQSPPPGGQRGQSSVKSKGKGKPAH